MRARGRRRYADELSSFRSCALDGATAHAHSRPAVIRLLTITIASKSSQVVCGCAVKCADYHH